MAEGNKTLNVEYGFLRPADLPVLYETNLEAFSDYLVPLRMTEPQFENHLAQNAVDIRRSVGAFSDGKLVGYTLNGFGSWKGKKTAYDAGTGVIPAYRRQGIGKAMFKFLLPYFKTQGIEQMLLEVICNNEKAVRLYRNLGFEVTRKLLFFEQTERIESGPKNGIRIRRLEKPVWESFRGFWDRPTSWQFSAEAVGRKLLPKMFFGAFSGDKCIGYGILYPFSGVVSQIAVDKNRRRQGAATMLLTEMQKHTKNDKMLRFSNVDENLETFVKLTEKLNFKPTISQFEMLLKI